MPGAQYASNQQTVEQGGGDASNWKGGEHGMQSALRMRAQVDGGRHSISIRRERNAF